MPPADAERGPDVRAMVLAAGLGTRLRPLTATLPKPLVPALGVPLLECTFDLLRRAGVRRVALNVHHLAARMAAAARELAQRAELDLTVLEEPQILGTGGGVRGAASLLGGADAVVVVNGDTFLDPGLDLGAIVRSHLTSGAAATMLVRENPDPVAYPPVEADADLRVRRIAGRPAAPGPPAGDRSAAPLHPWLFAGVHVLAPRLLDLLEPGKPSDINRALYPEIIAGGERVLAAPFALAWADIGTPARLLAANLELLDAPPPRLLELAAGHGLELIGGSLRPSASAGGAVDPSARVVRSVLAGAVTVEAGAVVEGSLVLPGARIGCGARVTGSFVAVGAKVAPGAILPRRLLAADGGEAAIEAERSGANR
jgi:mannose-1-phosphate guanylyltransferase